MRRYIIIIVSLFIPCVAAAQGSALPVFDIHVHLRDGERSLRTYLSDTEAAGGQVAGLGAMWFGGPHQALAGELKDIRARNNELIALAQEYPEVLPIGTVHPYDGQAALKELARIADRDVSVIKLHPHTQQFDVLDPRVLALVREAGKLGMVVLMDNANILTGDSENLFNLAVRVPQTKFVFAHIGGLNFRFWNILALARTADGFSMDNVYFDISGTVLLAANTPIEDEFVWTLRNVGVERLLLGSDYPQISLASTLKALEQLDLTSEEKNMIRYGNAQALFDSGDPSVLKKRDEMN